MKELLVWLFGLDHSLHGKSFRLQDLCLGEGVVLLHYLGDG